MGYITNYYKQLFGEPEHTNFSLEFPYMNKITDEDREILTQEFSLQEINNVVFDMEKNKAPGPDGFPVEFYQNFWEIIKYDLKALFDDFHTGLLSIERLNYGVITLLPKSPDAHSIQKYRPICLLM